MIIKNDYSNLLQLDKIKSTIASYHNNNKKNKKE